MTCQQTIMDCMKTSMDSGKSRCRMLFRQKYKIWITFSRASESPTKGKLNNEQNDFGNGIDPYYQTTRYWNTLKTTNNQLNSSNQDDVMASSMNNIDLVNYSNIDFGAAQQKIMSLSLGPQQLTQPQVIPVPPPMPFQQPQYCTTMSYSNFNALNNQMSSSYIQPNSKAFFVQLHPNGGPLGITLAGNEDSQKPIVISGLEEGGIAFNTGQIQIGDILLAINNESVSGIPLMEAKKLLQANTSVIELKLSRIGCNNDNSVTSSVISMGEKIPQPQALYAKVQRRPRSPPQNPTQSLDIISNGSNSTGSDSDNQYKTIHVTLFKDQVYDDYGFSVSDGLYEKGVYINRIRTGGPADNVGILKPYDRIVQVSAELMF